MKKFLFLLLLVAAGGGAWYADQNGWIKLPYVGKDARQQTAGPAGRGPGGPGRRQEPPVPVIAVAAKTADVPVTTDVVGTVQALNTVTVRAQADGRLLELLFKDGQEVKAGEILARIDSRTYQAQYDQAVAKKAQDEAQLANARLDLERYTRLAATNFGSKQQADTQRAQVAQLEALVQVDQAQIDNAKALLDNATIRAPIDGRTGIRAVDVGNLVRQSDTNGIVTITQVKPISILFNLPQQQLRALKAAFARGPVTVHALEPDNATMIEPGTVEVIDNQVDQTTGTIKVKATFSNANQLLWPGQFVNVRLFVDTLRDVIVVPTSAVQRGPTGPFLYVVRDDDTVKKTDVAVGRQDEQTSVIERGVAPPVRVVTTGFSRISDGSRVAPTSPEESQPRPAAETPPANQRGRGQRRGDLGTSPGAPLSAPRAPLSAPG